MVEPHQQDGFQEKKNKGRQRWKECYLTNLQRWCFCAHGPVFQGILFSSKTRRKKGRLTAWASTVEMLFSFRSPIATSQFFAGYCILEAFIKFLFSNL